jgi:hypothetical protein
VLPIYGGIAAEAGTIKPLSHYLRRIYRHLQLEIQIREAIYYKCQLRGNLKT